MNKKHLLVLLPAALLALTSCNPGSSSSSSSDSGTNTSSSSTSVSSSSSNVSSGSSSISSSSDSSGSTSASSNSDASSSSSSSSSDSSSSSTSTSTPVVKYAVTITASEHGSVTADKMEAEEGETVTLTITPDTNYHLSWLKCNGTDINVVAGSTSATVNMVKNGITITYEMAIDTANVSIGTLEHGSVTADKTTAGIGENVILTVTPDSGYELDTLTVNGATTSVTDGKATVAMVASGLSVSATFTDVLSISSYNAALQTSIRSSDSAKYR